MTVRTLNPIRREFGTEEHTETEEFEDDVDFNLTESGVEPLYAQITVPFAETERRVILHEIHADVLE